MVSTQELERRVAEALTAYAKEVVVVTEKDVDRMHGELQQRLRVRRILWQRPRWFAPAAAVAVVALLLGWFMFVRPLAPVPDTVSPAPVTSAAPYDQLGAPCGWVTQADVKAALGDLAPGFWPQAVTRSELHGVGSPTGPSWDMSCEVDVNGAGNRLGALTIQTAGFDSPSAAQQYLLEHWVRSPRPSWTSSPLDGVGDAAFYLWAPPGYGVRLIVLEQARFTLIQVDDAPLKTNLSSQLVELYGMAHLPG